MVAIRFEEHETVLQLFPLYVKNRDPRVDYQPKVLRGRAGRKVLVSLAEMSKTSASGLVMAGDHGTIRLLKLTYASESPANTLGWQLFQDFYAATGAT